MRIACFNVLADCYSYSQLPSANVPLPIYLNWDSRKQLLTDVLTACDADLLCLQEIDHLVDFYSPLLTNLEYSLKYVSRTGSRQDGCLLAFKNDYELLGYEEIKFDDIASYLTSDTQKTNVKRYNVAQIALLQHKRDCLPFVCTNSHFYWNPRRPEVKRLQAEYLVQRVDNFLEHHHLSHSSAPVFLAGDYNSVPSSEIYHMMTKGFMYSLTDRIRTTSNIRREGWSEFDDIVSYGADTKFLCDSTLTRLCRWMRVLGIDTKIITSPSDLDNSNMLDNSNTNGKKGTRRKGAFVELFELARNEKRVILTTSKTMRERAACPPSFLVSTRNLEQALVEVIREYGLILNQEKFLTVCGKCGGDIEACQPDDPRITGKSTIIPPTDRDLFCCVQCYQPYWWSERENSSPARAMKMADKLYNTVVQQLAGEVRTERDAMQVIMADKLYNTVVQQLAGEVNSVQGMDRTDDVLKISDVDHIGTVQSQEVMTLTSASIKVTQDMEKPSSVTTTGTSLDQLFATRNAVILAKPISSSSATMLEESIPSPIRPSRTNIDNNHGEDSKFSPTYRSAYASFHGKEATTTNWSMDFKDTLDYVFVSDAFTVNQAVVIPSIPTDDSDSESRNIPSDSFPIKTMEDLLSVKVDTAQPSVLWPSDHFLLVFDLSINPLP